MSVNPNQLSGVFADRLDNWLVPDQHYVPRTLMFTMMVSDWDPV